jgi:peptidoglycan L-alanyl-D-glutamate endopeptidase CwlK
MTLAQRSELKLQGVHPDLVAIVRKADEMGARFHVTCGMRTIDEQKALVAAGKSKTMKSRHLTGHAVDVVAVTDDGVSYDMDDMTAVARKMKSAAADLGIPIEWGAAAKYGGDFKTFNDSPHFQLPWKDYPANGPPPPHVEAAKPLAKSRTMWGTIGAAGSGVALYAEQTMAIALEVIAAMASLEPLKLILQQAGANIKAIGLGTLVFCCTMVISQRARIKQEGGQP